MWTCYSNKLCQTNLGLFNQCTSVLNFWLGLLVAAYVRETYFTRPQDMQPYNGQILQTLGNMNSRYSVFPGPNDHVTQSLDVCKTIIVTADLDMNSWIFFKQVMLSIFLFPYSLYLSLAYWIYPLKDNIGDTGCYVAIYGRDIGNYVTQTHSFFMAMFRYNCLFNGIFLKKINLSPKVSSCFEFGQTKAITIYHSFILFLFDVKRAI